MALFEWKNGTKIQNAVVTGDGVTVQDAVWEGETPISASNLNSAQQQLKNLVMPTGTILQYGGTTAPEGFLLCDGSAISRTTYSSLFSVLGTNYGNGDGSTTFNLPDLQGKIPVGYDSLDTDFNSLGETGGEKTHTLIADEIPSHKHDTWEGANSSYSLLDSHATGASVSGYGANLNSITAKKMETSSIGGGQAHNNLQPYVVVNYIIKY